MVIAYLDSDAADVRAAWPIGGVSLGNGIPCTIDGESGILHQHEFGPADEAAIRLALGDWCRFDWQGVVPVDEPVD